MLAEIEARMRTERNTPEGDRLDVLVTQVLAYEAEHHPIEAPDPSSAVECRMEQPHSSERVR